MTSQKLDLKNKKILSELETNARITHTSLAKKVGLSKQVIKYRIEKLEKQNIIQSYNAIIDLNKLGKTIYLIYLKLTNLSSTKEKQWIKKIDKHPDIIATGKNAGYWDLTIALNCANNQEFDKTYKQITSGKQINIKDKIITSEIESSYFSTGIPHKKTNTEFKTTNHQSKAKLDDKDLQIIHLLAENCQLSLLDISEKIKLTPNAAKHRIKNLEKEKVIIGYKTKINFEALGYLHFRVFINTHNFTKELYNEIKDHLKTIQGIESTSQYIGHADIDFRCYTKNLYELHQLITKIKDKFIKEIIDIDSMPIFGWEKIKYYSN